MNTHLATSPSLTWKPERASLRSPLYQSIAESLADDIADGVLRPNSKLPPQRELADWLGVSLNTITRAYTICERKGLIYGSTGSGTYVSPNAAEAVFNISDAYGQGCIEMGVIEPFAQLNAEVLPVIREVVGRADLAQFLEYSLPTGHPRHKQAGQRWLALCGHEVRDANEILITSGTQNSLAVVLASLFQAGDRVALDQHSYPIFIELAKMLHIQLVPVAGDLEGMRPDSLDEQCRINKISGLYLVPACNNPTAVAMQAERRRQLAGVIDKHSLLLIEDSVHAFLEEEPRPPLACFAPERTIFLGNISKAVTSGLRVSFLHAPERYRQALIGGHYSINLKTSSLNAAITAELILGGLAEDIARRKAGLGRAREARMAGFFPAQRQPRKLQQLFWWMELPQHLAGLSGAQVERLAEEAGLRFFHSNRFCAGSPEGPPQVRVSICTAKTEAEFAEGAERLQKLFSPPEHAKGEAMFIV